MAELFSDKHRAAIIHPLNLMVMKLLTLCLALASASLATAADKPAHIFILSGQSNMAGMNPKAGFEPEAAKLFPDAAAPYIKVAADGQPIRYWVTEWDEIAKKHGIDPAKARAGDKNKGTIYYQPILDQFVGLLKKHPHRTVRFHLVKVEAALERLELKAVGQK
jgi:hypothetical protein